MSTTYKFKDFENNPYLKNFGKKTIAVFIAVILWFVANVEFDVERTLEINVNYSNLDRNLIITNDPPKKVKLRLQGPRSIISSLSDTSLYITLDLSDISEGISRYEIQEKHINLPRDVNIISISPAEIVLNVDKVVTKIVRIEPNISPPDRGYKLAGKPRVFPEKVKIKGPKTILSKLDSIKTNPISIAGEKSQFTIQVPLQPPSNLVEIVGPKLVTVTINLERVNIQKEFENLGVDFKNFDNIHYTVKENSLVSLTFYGPYDLLNDLRSNDIKVYVDANHLKSKNPGSYELPVMVDYPNSDTVRLKSISPKKIKINIENRD